MRCLKFYSVVLLYITLFSAASLARIGLILEYEATVPGLDQPIQQLALNDIDGDNEPEILVCDGRRLLLFAPQSNQILMDQPIDTNFLNYRLALGDVNGDEIADVIFGHYKCGGYCDPVGSGGTDTCRIHIFDAQNNYERTYTKWYFIDRFTIYLQSRGITALKVLDYDKDGRNDLLMSIDSASTAFTVGYLKEHTCGITEIYSNFPYWLRLKQNRTVFDLLPIDHPHADGLLYESWVCEVATELQSFFSHEENLYTSIVDENGTIISYAPTPSPVTSSQSSTGAKHITAITPACQGRMLGSQTYRSLLCTYNINGAVGQRMFRYRPPDTLQPVWENDEVFSDYVYHPDFPRYYLAFDGNTLIQFKGIDGSRFQQVDGVAADLRFWDTPYDDTIPRLVMVNGSTVKIYKLDISTSAGEFSGESNALPTSLTLHDPHPNPFNAEVAIPMTIERPGHLRVEIYNIMGRKVETLTNRAVQPGEFRLRWGAEHAPSGIYLINVKFGDERLSARVVLLK